MPETPPSHTETSPPETQEQILTPEDRERLSLLCAEASENLSLMTGDRDSRAVELRRRIRDENGRAARYILDFLNSRSEILELSDLSIGDDYEAYHYICLLNLCASDHNAEEISKFLIRDDVSLVRDRSLSSKIVELLFRIGTPTNIEDLIQYTSNCFSSTLDIRFQRQDALSALEVLIAIALRNEDEDGVESRLQGERISNAIEEVKRIIADHTGREITDDEDYFIARDLLSGDRYRDFNSLFEVEEPRAFGSAYDPYDGDDERNMSQEDERDSEIEDAYREHRFTEATSRLEVIKRLRHEIKKEQEIQVDPEDDEGKFLRRHWLEYREHNPSPYTPTLGIEIEIREHTVLPKEAKDWDLFQKSDFFKDKIVQYRETEKIGVGKGNDAFWEFAHNPVRNYTTLSREVQALMEMGLINKDYHKHSLHITVGGVSSEGMGGEGSFVLARALEATGWGTTGGRIMRPYLLKRGAWTYKGQAGVKERDIHEIQLDVSCAIEIRTMQVQGLTGLDRLLRSCYLLGAALKAYQDRESRFGSISDGDSDIKEQLGSIWEVFAEETYNIFIQYGLTDPAKIWEVPDRFHKEGEEARGDFVPFAVLLDEARQHPKSRGAEFVAKMRGLIIKTRKQVADLVYTRGL